MAVAHLTLSADFARHMELKSAWPRYRRFKPWLTKNNENNSSDALPMMKRGESVPAAYVRRFLEYIFDSDYPDETRGYMQAAVVEYLEAHGWFPEQTLTADTILPFVVDPPDEDEDGVDVIAMGPKGLSRVIDAIGLADRYVMGCYDKQGRCDESAVRRNVNWMVVSCGRFMANDLKLPIPDAIQRAYEVMRISEREYADRAIGWQKKNPWTVVFSRARGVPNGQSIMLPVTPSYYKDVIEGRCATYDCTPKDIQPMSQFVILEAGFDRPKDLGGFGNPTRPLLAAMLAQLGALSRCDRLAPDEALTILSFAPHPVAERRLSGVGFKPTGTQMARTGVPLMVRTFRRAAQPFYDYMFRTFMDRFAATLDRPPVP